MNKKETLDDWLPEHPPLYDINKTYAENASLGPFFQGNFPQRKMPLKTSWKDFLGFKVASCLGIPAGPLLNARWIGAAAKFGFDILTYKTIRSSANPGHGLPNVIYIDQKDQLNPSHLPPHVLERSDLPQETRHLAITNSFGMPSQSPEFLRLDIPKAKASLQQGQVLVVSVVGTPEKNNPQAFIKDFVQTARFAKECGADIIEANFSCPNVTTGEGCVYINPSTVYEISSNIIKAIQDTPLIIKVGLFPNLDIMKSSFLAAAKAGVLAISGINTISMPVINKEGKPALGQSRLTSGICGNPIRTAALDFIRHAASINGQEKLGLTLIGVGGIVLPEHFDLFFEAGADFAQTATGMMWDPYLAMRYFTLKKGVSHGISARFNPQTA